MSLMDFLLQLILPQRESQPIQAMISEQLTDLATASNFSLRGVIFRSAKHSCRVYNSFQSLRCALDMRTRQKRAK